MILLLQKGVLVLEASRIADALERIEIKVKNNGADGTEFAIYSAKLIPFNLETKAIRATVMERIKRGENMMHETNHEMSKPPRTWQEESLCPECEEIREGDERVRAGMKCGLCSYPLKWKTEEEEQDED